MELQGSSAASVLDSYRQSVSDRAEPASGRVRHATGDKVGTVALVVPTRNAGEGFRQFLEALQAQAFKPDRQILIDSSSTDDTVALGLRAGFEALIIRAEEFNHGRTRQAAVEMLDGSDFVLFMTQDAVLASPDSLGNLLRVFRNPTVAAVYGRQLPRPGAGHIEAHARLFNYADRSYVRGKEHVPRFGFKTSFFSNSFAAWRRKALCQVGGFPADMIQNEDVWATSRLIEAGWRLAYCAEAQVYHSHSYSCLEEFRRYFDIGVFHARNRWIRQAFGRTGSEGFRYVMSELGYLLRTDPRLIPSAVLRTALKLAGYKLGDRESLLPPRLKRHFSSNRSYWDSHNDNGNNGIR